MKNEETAKELDLETTEEQARQEELTKLSASVTTTLDEVPAELPYEAIAEAMNDSESLFSKEGEKGDRKYSAEDIKAFLDSI